MCGINGIWSFKNKTIEEDRFLAMRDSLRHRGPDGAASWFSENSSLALGHRRLAFMDLGPEGMQPLLSEDRKIIATVNGEIYNYPELKQILQSKGYVFRSGSDSEVIIHGWREWGPELPSKLKGMFAFAVRDENENVLFLARDRFGIKPLYYFHTDDEFGFASEIKALIKWKPELKEIDFTQMARFFTYRYIPSPNSIYKKVFKIPPAHQMLIKANTQAEIKQYWALPDEVHDFSDTEIMERTEFLLSESVRTHMQSDVPVGSFLSGGYDSSAIVYYLHKLGMKANTFSLGFEDWEMSEHRFAEKVADKFDMPLHTKILKGDSLDALPSLFYHYDEPIADISILPTYEISRLAVSKNKAILSGEGADEMFCGYTWHYENMAMQERERSLSRLFRKKKAFSAEQYSIAMAMGPYREQELKALFNPDLHKELPGDADAFYKQHFNSQLPGLLRFQKMDTSCFMGELVLTKIDRASMAHSLEVRVPFLDHELAEFLFALPPEKKFKKGYKKYILHELIKKDMPTEILNRNKQGFVGPDSFYQNPSWYRPIIEDSALLNDSLLNSNEINRQLQHGEYWKLWKFAVMEFWYRFWMKGGDQ